MGALQVQDLPAIVLSPAQYYNYTQPRGNFIPTSLTTDHYHNLHIASRSVDIFL